MHILRSMCSLPPSPPSPPLPPSLHTSLPPLSLSRPAFSLAFRCIYTLKVNVLPPSLPPSLPPPHPLPPSLPQESNLSHFLGELFKVHPTVLDGAKAGVARGREVGDQHTVLVDCDIGAETDNVEWNGNITISLTYVALLSHF